MKTEQQLREDIIKLRAALRGAQMMADTEAVLGSAAWKDASKVMGEVLLETRETP